MADLSKFEQMLERLINEDRDGAQDLFHEIVVEKSRSIYESLLESDDEDEEMEEASEEDEDEDDDEEGYNEDFNLDEFEVEADDDMMGGDATDDMIGDLGAEDGEDDEVDFDMGGEGEEGDVEDRVVDLEDALDELKAEFDKMIGGEDDMGFMPGDGDDEEGDFGDDEEDEEGDEEEEDESFQFEAKKDDKKDDKKDAKKDAKKKTSGEEMREYVEKVQGGDLGSKIGGDNGTNTKSTVASPNKMGDGTTDNIARSDEYSNGDHAGLGDLNAKDQDAGNVNKPGGKASKSMKAQPKGHGTEKKGSGESGAYTKPVVGGSKKK